MTILLPPMDLMDKEDDCQHYHKGDNGHHVRPDGSARFFV